MDPPWHRTARWPDHLPRGPTLLRTVGDEQASDRTVCRPTATHLIRRGSSASGSASLTRRTAPACDPRGTRTDQRGTLIRPTGLMARRVPHGPSTSPLGWLNSTASSSNNQRVNNYLSQSSAGQAKAPAKKGSCNAVQYFGFDVGYHPDRSRW